MNQTINKIFARTPNNTKLATPFAILFGLFLFAFLGGPFSTLDADRVPDIFIEFEVESSETTKLKFLVGSATKADPIPKHHQTLNPEMDVAVSDGRTLRYPGCTEFQRQNRAPPCRS